MTLKLRVLLNTSNSSKVNCLPVPWQIPSARMQACEMIYYLTGNGGQR